MAYEVIIPYHLHMPSYLLGTFTEYPYLFRILNIHSRFSRIFAKLVRLNEFCMDKSQNIEYKAIRKDEYYKWIRGFANANGGRIFLGEDDDPPHKAGRLGQCRQTDGRPAEQSARCSGYHGRCEPSPRRRQGLHRDSCRAVSLSCELQGAVSLPFRQHKTGTQRRGRTDTKATPPTARFPMTG